MQLKQQTKQLKQQNNNSNIKNNKSHLFSKQSFVNKDLIATQNRNRYHRKVRALSGTDMMCIQFLFCQKNILKQLNTRKTPPLYSTSLCIQTKINTS